MGQLQNEYLELQKGLRRHKTSYYKNIYVNIIEWKNLPKGVKSERIERMLYERGSVVFFKHDTLGFLTLPHSNHGINVYGEPITVKPIGQGRDMSFMKYLTLNDDAVRVKNNESADADKYMVDFYVSTIVDIEGAINANRQAIKMPIMFTGTDKTTRSVKAMINKITNNDPAIVIDKDMSTGLHMDVPQVAYHGGNLMMQKHEYKNELYEFLGINNANTDKKERMITDEVNANNEQVSYSLKMRLNQRKKAVKQINEMFNLNIDVEVNMEAINNLKKEKEEGDEDAK